MACTTKGLLGSTPGTASTAHVSPPVSATFILLTTGAASIQPWATQPASARSTHAVAEAGLIDRALEIGDARTRSIAARAARDLLESLPLEDVIAATNSPQAAVRAHAAHVLGDRRGPAAVPSLVLALTDSITHVRNRAAWALAEIAHGDAVPALIRTAAGDVSIAVRRHAIRALGETGDRTATPHLIAWLQNDHAGIRAQSADALGDMRDPAAVPHLEAILDDPDPGVRRNASTALRRIHP